MKITLPPPLKISELITKLQEIQEQIGDVRIHNACSEITDDYVRFVDFENYDGKQEAYIL